MVKIYKFGSFIREFRIKKDIGQRELAKKINISASYLNDIEKNKRPAPKLEILKKISKILDIDFKYLNDLASISNKDIAPDIYEFIKNKPEITSFLRILKESDFNKSDLSDLEKKILKNKTKVLIVAAVLGSRLKKHTEELPKCMLDFGGKTLLQRQIDAYKQNGIKDISLIKGYKKNKINYKGIKYFSNTDFKNNNILNSIFYAEKIINGNIIISYSDILFEPFVVKRALESNHDISIVVDIDWRGYYVNRKEHPITEDENVIFNSDNEVVKIAKINTGRNDVHGEFIGMLKLSNKGAEIFKSHFNRCKKLYWNKPFHRAKIFQQAYLTDMIQELVDVGVKVNCVIIEKGWKEIDTVEDYRKALVEFK